MLDMEKKLETRMEEVQVDLRKDLLKVVDDRDLRKDFSNLLEDKMENLEFNFNSKVLTRLDLLEKAYD